MKEVVYQYSNKGFYLGETIAYGGQMPIGTTKSKPRIEQGFIPFWNGTSWELVENHVGESGYVDNIPFEIKEYGAYPIGWTKEYVKSFDEVKAEKLSQAKQMLSIFKARTFTVNNMSFPKDYAHIYEWLVFAKYKEMGIIDSKAVMLDSLGYNMNAHSVDLIEGSMFQLMREITTLNAENKSLLDRINACTTIEELEAIEIIIPEQ